MDNWHATQWTKSDIAVFPGLDVPACMNCGEICPSHGADNKLSDELQIPLAGKRSAMQLNWPPSMPYQNHAYSHDPDGSLHKALASLVDQEWCDKETDKHTSCSSVINTARTTSLQASKTSYESLDVTNIRVLRLHKGYFGDCLHADFETVSLQSQKLHHQVLCHMKPFHIPGPKEMANGTRTTLYSSESVGTCFQSLRTVMMPCKTVDLMIKIDVYGLTQSVSTSQPCLKGLTKLA